MGRNFTSPVKPMQGQAIKADHMQNHARAIEELQRLIIPTQKRNQLRRVTQTGPFCKKYIDTGVIMLLGGIVSGGTGNETIPDITLATIGMEPVDGTHVWMQVSVTAYTEDGVLLPGCDVTAALSGEGVTLPDNTIPTEVDPSGVIYISLGSWSNGSFVPSACGNILVSHCLGELTHNHYTYS